jgi:hypothetical protein
MAAGREPAPVEVTYSLQREDLVGISASMAKRSYRPPPRRRSEIVGVVGLLAVFLIVMVAADGPSEALRSWPVWLLAGVLLLLLLRRRIWLGLCRMLAKRSAKTLDGCGLPMRFRASSAGIAVSNQGTETALAWADVGKIERLGDYVLLHTGPGKFFVVPMRAFDTASGFDAFEADLRRLKAATPGEDGESGPALPPVRDAGKT